LKNITVCKNEEKKNIVGLCVWCNDDSRLYILMWHLFLFDIPFLFHSTHSQHNMYTYIYEINKLQLNWCNYFCFVWLRNFWYTFVSALLLSFCVSVFPVFCQLSSSIFEREEQWHTNDDWVNDWQVVSNGMCVFVFCYKI
jgi:hypothetical protein